MSAYFELAYALASKRLCLFTGTGFSKAITDGQAPGWQKLLEDCCMVLPEGKKLKSELFPSSGNLLSLEESAQVIDIELRKKNKNIHDVSASIISEIKLSGDNTEIKKFLNSSDLRIVTTNYDKLIESFIDEEKNVLSMAPGLPIPRSTAKLKVYHVHGSIESPQHMIVTSSDYFHFLNHSSYFAKKLSTILHENTVVILGYSLGDTNLKSILNAYKGFSKDHASSSNIFFVSKDKISSAVKDYYSYCYGIRVIDRTSITDLFLGIDAQIKKAKDCVEVFRSDMDNVINKDYVFKDNFLKVEDSFFQIITSLGAIGKGLKDRRTVEIIGNVISRKISYTSSTGAWEQYTHLARWLVYLGSIVDLNDTHIKNKFLEATEHSMNCMSEELRFGSSWQAYKAWNLGWLDMMASNRILIREYMSSREPTVDTLKIIEK